MTTAERVIKVLAAHLEMDEAEITADTTMEELDVDSLDTVEILMEMEDEFGVSIQPSQVKITKVSDLSDYIDTLL
ncbi:MAG: acyl carrier protein [Clostridia bacterium]|nr:acyl carrier protein [Clostridia bacterium]